MQQLNPCKLRDLSDESRAAVIAFLEAMHKKHEEFLEQTVHTDTPEQVDAGQLTAIGLEIVLEALGAEGYEYT